MAAPKATKPDGQPVSVTPEMIGAGIVSSGAVLPPIPPVTGSHEKLKPEVVLLGTGETQRFIQPRLGCALTDAGLGIECMSTATDAGVGIECMSTAAACRTYNFS